MAEAKVDMEDVYRQITLHATVHERLATSVRARLALWLLGLAGWVAPWGMVLENAPDTGREEGA